MGEGLKNVVFFRPLSLPSQCLQGLWITFYLPMQKLEKIRPNKSSELNAPVISPNSCCA